MRVADFEMPQPTDWVEFYDQLQRGRMVANPDTGELQHRLRWNEDEHVTLIGPTGSGKTTLAYYILPLRTHVCMIATKPGDSSLERFARSNGFVQMSEWKEGNPRKTPRRLLWPKLDTVYKQPEQRKQIRRALEDMYVSGGWNIYLDEVRYVSDDLKLRRFLNIYLLQYRSQHGSLIAATQRPSWIPREFYSQSTHLFFWRQTNDTDIDAIGGIGALSSRYIRWIIPRLREHQFLYLHAPTGYMTVSTAPNPD